MSGFTLELPSTEKIKKEVQIELTLQTEEKEVIDSGVKEKGDAILSVNLDSYDERKEFAGVADSFGQDVIDLSRKRNNVLSSNISNFTRSGTDTGDVAVGIANLTSKMKNLDPAGIDFTRNSLLGKLFNPAKKYFERFEAADRDIAGILEVLSRGRSTLKNDNTTLELEEVSMRKLTKLLTQNIEFGSLLCSYLSSALEKKKMHGMDEQKVQFIEQEILYPLEQRILDFQQMLVVNQQGIIALEVVRKNNAELIRAVDRAQNVTVASLRVAATVASALYNQKIVLDKVNSLNNATNHMITATSSLLRTQGVEIQKQSMNANISIDALKKSFSDTLLALEDISLFRERAIPQMERAIEQFRDIAAEGEQQLKRMDSGNRINLEEL